MSKAAKKPYVIRGFNIATEGVFDCRDMMTKFNTFTELSADKQHDAVVELTTHSNLCTMSTRNLLHTQSGSVLDPDQTREVYVIDLTLVTIATTVNQLRPFRSAVRDALKTWAEKSRVKQRRGWRLSAVKTPTFEYDVKLGRVVIKTQVILGTTVYYSNKASMINANFDQMMEQEDLRNLHRYLENVLDGYYSHIKYRHSVIGEGEVV